MCDENLLTGMKMFRKTLTFCETSRKILDINISAALHIRCVQSSCNIVGAVPFLVRLCQRLDVGVTYCSSLVV